MNNSKRLTENSEEPLDSSLKSIDLNKEKIKSPKDLLVFLITSKDQLKYPEESVFKSIANLIASQNIPAGTIKSRQVTGEGNSLVDSVGNYRSSDSIILYNILKKKKEGKKINLLTVKIRSVINKG